MPAVARPTHAEAPADLRGKTGWGAFTARSSHARRPSLPQPDPAGPRARPAIDMHHHRAALRLALASLDLCLGRWIYVDDQHARPTRADTDPADHVQTRNVAFRNQGWNNALASSEAQTDLGALLA